ncbi:MAG: class I SAM-dependent methyltransferase [Candidatus Velthaea sp.]
MSFDARFSGRATAYAASRPDYGTDALDFILAKLTFPVVAADLGAGTGISSRLLAARGAHVIAVEPNAAMRGKAAPHERVRFVDATGERTGLPDESVDLVTMFQAFHWFEPESAVAEIRRILRPKGRACVVLNERDERDAPARDFGDLVRRYAVDDTEERRAASLQTFRRLGGAIEEREFPNAHVLDRAGLHTRIKSSSYLPHAGDASQAMHREADALFDRHAAGGSIRLALRTIVVRADLH